MNREDVEKIIDEIRPMLQRDGGDVELVEIEGGKVKVRLKGACAGCPAANHTLKMGIERILKQKVPGVEEVVQA
jgi:Fe-S cluster biogenesis protein NfuA